MAPQTRAQRRQQNARQAARANTAPTRTPESAPSNPAELELPEAPVIDLTPRPVARQSRQAARRPINRPVPEPVDYSQDYVVARSDLVKIAIWSILLFGGMVVIKLIGLV